LASFSYVAYEDSGRRLKGVVDAIDQDSAMSAVAAKGLHVLEISESGGQQSAAKQSTSGSVSRGDLALFTRRLADLARAGLPLDRALQVAGEQSENATLEAITEEAIREVRAGVPISEALAKYPKLFPTVFTMTLRAGEASGQFPQVAGRLAEFQQLEVRRRSQITSALVYPCILALTAVGVIAILMFFVVPKLSGVFGKLGNSLPISTVLLLKTSSFLFDHFLLIMVALLAILVAYRAAVNTPEGALARDRALMKAPVFGKVVSKAVVSRYARVLGTLLYGGVPILESLRIAGAASGNKVFERSSLSVQNDVREGKRLGEAMKETGEFSSILVQMVSVGEETGELPEMLGRVSETLDFEVDTGVQKLTTIIEPLIVLTMGTFVGFVVLSILLPVYQAQDLIK
jgi:type II secretory pathway component PulF